MKENQNPLSVNQAHIETRGVLNEGLNYTQESLNNKIEENPSIINDIISGNCEIKFISKKTDNDPKYDDYRSEIVELEIKYPSSINKDSKLEGSIFIYYPQKHNEIYKKEPEMRVEIKWHKGSLLLGDGNNEEYLSSILKEIHKQAG